MYLSVTIVFIIGFAFFFFYSMRKNNEIDELKRINNDLEYKYDNLSTSLKELNKKNKEYSDCLGIINDHIEINFITEYVNSLKNLIEKYRKKMIYKLDIDSEIREMQNELKNEAKKFNYPMKTILMDYIDLIFWYPSLYEKYQIIIKEKEEQFNISIKEDIKIGNTAETLLEYTNGYIKNINIMKLINNIDLLHLRMLFLNYLLKENVNINIEKNIIENEIVKLQEKINENSIISQNETITYKLYYEDKNDIISETTITINNDGVIFSDWYFSKNHEDENEIFYRFNKIPRIIKSLNENYTPKEFINLSNQEIEFYDKINNYKLKELFLYCLSINLFDAREFNKYLLNYGIKEDNYLSK